MLTVFSVLFWKDEKFIQISIRWESLRQSFGYALQENLSDDIMLVIFHCW